MKRLLLIISFCLIFFVSGCNVLESGIIDEKEFVPEHSAYDPGSKTTKHFPDCYYIYVKGKFDGETRYEKYQVSKIEYQHLQVNQQINIDDITEVDLD